MNTTLGPMATRIHLLLVLVVAITGLAILVMVLGVMFLSDDQYSRDMGVLGLLITTPLWVTGLVAAFDTILVLRRGRVGMARALVWALIVLIGGVFVAVTGGALGAVFMLLSEPSRLYLEWPVLAVPSGSEGGVQYFHLDSAGFWAPFVAMLLGAASLGALILQRSRH